MGTKVNTFYPPLPPIESFINWKQIISRLPDDIVHKIYKEYVEAEYYYILYKQIIKHHRSNNLDNELLTPMIPVLLSKQNVVDYLYKKCFGFRNTYREHNRKLGKKVFKNLNFDASFALSILFNLYH
jgi:hypothetical protein